MAVFQDLGCDLFLISLTFNADDLWLQCFLSFLLHELCSVWEQMDEFRSELNSGRYKPSIKKMHKWEA